MTIYIVSKQGVEWNELHSAEVGEKSNTYEDACNVLCDVLGASLDESEHMLP